jgi:hypothetical protein
MDTTTACGGCGGCGGGGGGAVGGGGCSCNPLLVKLERHELDCDIGYIANNVYINAVCDCNCRSTLREELRKLHFTVDNVCEIMAMTEEETNIIKMGHKSLHNEEVWLKFCRPISALPPNYERLYHIQALLKCKCCDKHQKRRMWFF